MRARRAGHRPGRDERTERAGGPGRGPECRRTRGVARAGQRRAAPRAGGGAGQRNRGLLAQLHGHHAHVHPARRARGGAGGAGRRRAGRRDRRRGARRRRRGLRGDDPRGRRDQRRLGAHGPSSEGLPSDRDLRRVRRRRGGGPAPRFFRGDHGPRAGRGGKPRRRPLASARDGSEVWRAHAGLAAHNGLLAARLAAAGLTGPARVLDDPRGFCAAFTDGGFDAAALTGASASGSSCWTPRSSSTTWPTCGRCPSTRSPPSGGATASAPPTSPR